MTFSPHPELVLGTVQFGLEYGITNSAGRPSDEMLDDILVQAHGQIGWLDTSIKYGDALDRLGRATAAPYAIVTKIDGRTPAGAIEEIALTLAKLGRERLDAVLFHDPSIFSDGVLAAEVVAALRAEQSGGRIARIGASLYESREIEAALAVFTPDLLQLPSNIADRRLLDNGVAASLQQSGIDVHYRSAFLQGLLLSSLEDMSGPFSGLEPLLRELDGLAAELGVSRQTLCLHWVAGLPAASGVVCGIATLGELRPLVDAYEAAMALDVRPRLDDLANRVSIDPALLDPRRWASLLER